MSRCPMPATLPEPWSLDDDRVGSVRRNGCLRSVPELSSPATFTAYGLPARKKINLGGYFC